MTHRTDIHIRSANDSEFLVDLDAKCKAWGMKRSALVKLAVRMMPDEPPKYEPRANAGKTTEQNMDPRS